MKTWVDLGDELKQILGKPNVYYQSPSNVTMKYPAFRYKLENPSDRHANNRIYATFNRYTIYHIYKDPREDLIDELKDHFLMISGPSRNIVDGLYQDMYELYYG